MINPQRTDPRRRIRAVTLAALVPLASCNLFDVSSPGRISDEDLNSVAAAPGLVAGMSYNLAVATNGSNDILSLAAGELWHGGSYNWGDVPRGIILPEDVNTTWGNIMQARFVTESGIERLESSLGEATFNKSELVARAYMLGGFANRLIGESVCQTVIDGGAPQSNTVEFDRGIEKFTQAIQIGTASSADDIVTAAYAGRASLRAWKGDWNGAAADASQVPTDFIVYSVLMTEGASNTLAYETHDRYEYTVFSTEFANHPDDPRAPWAIVYTDDGKVATGANGSTPMYQQQKYEEHGSDIPLAKGTEMLVLRAEAALRGGSIPGAFALINQARAFYGMDELPVPTSLAEAWATLQYERGATTWLENRRLWDLRRWFAETGPAHNDFLKDRDSCIPISQNEQQSNPNVPKG